MKNKKKASKSTYVRQAERKAKIANAPQPPNRDMSMKGGTSI